MNQRISQHLPGTEQYEQLLVEAARVKGVSLGRDAWRRLRRNRVAMIAITFLIAIVMCSTFVSLIPLQSPKQVDLQERTFEPPNLQPRSLHFEDRSTEEANAGFAELLDKTDDESRKNLEQLRQELAAANDEDAQLKIREKIKHEQQRPVGLMAQLWPNPGVWDCLLIRARLALFGDWCLPSLCGTDQLGRDELARIAWGSRVSLIVGVVAALVSLVIGVSYGATAGYLGGLVDSIMMRIVDILYSIPFIFVVIFIISILDADAVKPHLVKWGINKIVIFYILIGAIYWLTMSRVVRGQVISLKHQQFVEAARTVGAGKPRIIFRHLVPNLLSVVIIYLTLTIPSVMLFEAFLSFLGLGVEPPDVSWGILAAEGVEVITPVWIVWWLVVFPGLALASTLLALNFLGDGLRDALDPRLKNK